jgi:hypothetical protein
LDNAVASPTGLAPRRAPGGKDVAASISAGHPLRELFLALVEQTFDRHLGLREPALSGYVSNVLVDFVHRDHLYRLRDGAGRSLEEVAEMLVEGDVQLEATSFERERAVHKHIGDFTLFWTGVYPEMLRFLRAASRRDHLVDYVQQGRKSYGLASTFTYPPHDAEAPILKRLSDDFELCMVGLNMVRRQLDALASPEMRAVQRLLQA